LLKSSVNVDTLILFQPMRILNVRNVEEL